MHQKPVSPTPGFTFASWPRGEETASEACLPLVAEPEFYDSVIPRNSLVLVLWQLSLKNPSELAGLSEDTPVT